MREGLLSVVVPAYNEEQMIPKTAETIENILSQARIAHEIIFVDDGSKDRTWDCIRTAAAADPHVRGIHFSRNFGKESAMFAGLAGAQGDCTAVIDCDLQHPPEKLPEMYALWQQGFEVIAGVKSNRGKESVLHGAAARLFYRLMGGSAGFGMQNASDFKLLDRDAVEALLQMPERHAFFRALSAWIGFKTASVSFEVQERPHGQSKWSAYALVKYAVTNIASFSTAPMQVVTFLGMLMFVISVILGIVSVTQKIMGVALGGFTTVIILLLFIGSIIMISLGIIGFYISQIYEEVKMRPRYIIASECGNIPDKEK